MNANDKVTKMDIARAIYKEIFTRGYELPKGKTQRAHFIERAMNEVPMSFHGAGTYYQNLSNEARGEKTYKYNKPSKKSKKTVAQIENVVFALGFQSTERWMAVNDKGYEVNSFSTRAKAQEFAKVNGLKWKDRQAA